MSLEREDDITDTHLNTIRTIHAAYIEDGYLTGHACLLAADDLATAGYADLADYLADTAQDMDRPVTLDDVMSTVQDWMSDRVWALQHGKLRARALCRPSGAGQRARPPQGGSMTTTRATLPTHLHAAYNWTDAAGELDTLRQLSGKLLNDYCADSAQNSANNGDGDVTVDHLLSVHDWLVAHDAH